VCLGRRLPVIDVRPALAVTAVKDGQGRKFVVSVLQKPEQAWTVPGCAKPALRESRSPEKVQNCFYFGPARGRWGTNPAGTPIYARCGSAIRNERK